MGKVKKKLCSNFLPDAPVVSTLSQKKQPETELCKYVAHASSSPSPQVLLHGNGRIALACLRPVEADAPTPQNCTAVVVAAESP